MTNQYPPVIIVPEGLAADENGKTLAAPSFCYAAVLDYARQRYNGAPLYLAPANRFGGDISEQQAAANYLSDWRGNVVAPPTVADSYVDTRGNAALLRRYCREKNIPPLPPAILLAGYRHIRRAALCFRREGFDIMQAVGVPYRIDAKACMPRRLWYYKHPAVHRLYEAAALLRDSCRF